MTEEIVDECEKVKELEKQIKKLNTGDKINEFLMIFIIINLISLWAYVIIK